MAVGHGRTKPWRLDNTSSGQPPTFGVVHFITLPVLNVWTHSPEAREMGHLSIKL